MCLIDPNRVTEIFLDCLFRDEEIMAHKPQEGEFVDAHGVMAHVGFNPQRLETHKEEIMTMLMNLPLPFRKSEGGGWSFLQACQDRNDEQWTGLHKVMDELLCLGLGTKQVEYLMPREMWRMFHGGMPYFVVLS